MTGQPLGSAQVVVKSAAQLAALTPSDGMVIVFQDETTLVDGTNTMLQLGLRWLFQYNGRSSSSYKWEAYGRQLPLTANIDTDEAGANATYQGLTTAQVITVPLGGDYYSYFTCETYNSAVAANFMSPNGVTGDEAVVSINTLGNTHALSPRTIKKTGLAAASTHTMQYKRSSGTANWRKRVFEMTPLRVG